MNNEVKVVLNENKVIYEKNEGRKMLRTAKYFKGDFIAFGILKTLITTTFAFMIVAIMYVLCNAEGLVENINSMDYLAFGRRVAIQEKVLRNIFQDLISLKDFITARRKESKYGGYNGGFIRTKREF